MITRRGFLQAGAAAPLIFGLDGILLPQEGVPEWYGAALKRMKDLQRYGVVLVAPWGTEEQKTYAAALQALLNAQNDDVAEVLCTTVFICVRPEIADRTVRKEGEKETRSLLSPDGKRVAADKVGVETLKPDAFVKSFRPFVYGTDESRLKTAAEALREKAPESVKTALERLENGTIDQRDEARSVLQAKVEGFAPLLAHVRATTTSQEMKSSLSQVFAAAAAVPEQKHVKMRLPYGTQVEMAEDPKVVDKDPCPTCGMMRVEPQLKPVLTFLAK